MIKIYSEKEFVVNKEHKAVDLSVSTEKALKGKHHQYICRYNKKGFLVCVETKNGDVNRTINIK